MTAINPRTFVALIGTYPAVELIDVRPREDFAREHIRGARSIPLSHLHAARIVRERGLRNSRPLFLVCHGRVRASLAAGLLREAGCLHPVVIDGGMESWTAQGLPTLQPLRRMHSCLRRPSAVVGPAFAWCRRKFQAPEPLSPEADLGYRPLVR